METKKYICLLPTGGHQEGDIVEMTEEEFAGQNANEPEPRFGVYEVEDIDPEGTSTETEPEQSSTEEGEEQSGEAVSEIDTVVPTEEEATPEETNTEESTEEAPTEEETA